MNSHVDDLEFESHKLPPPRKFIIVSVYKCAHLHICISCWIPLSKVYIILKMGLSRIWENTEYKKWNCNLTVFWPEKQPKKTYTREKYGGCNL